MFVTEQGCFLLSWPYFGDKLSKWLKRYLTSATNCCPQHVTGVLWTWCSAPQPASFLSSVIVPVFWDVESQWLDVCFLEVPQVPISIGLFVIIKVVQTHPTFKTWKHPLLRAISISVTYWILDKVLWTKEKDKKREVYSLSLIRAGTPVLCCTSSWSMRSLQKLQTSTIWWTTAISVFVSAYCLPLWLLCSKWANEYACSLTRNICPQ